MQQMSLEQTAKYLENANILATYDFGNALIHSGISKAGAQFVIVNDIRGATTLTESA